MPDYQMCLASALILAVFLQALFPGKHYGIVYAIFASLIISENPVSPITTVDTLWLTFACLAMCALIMYLPRRIIRG